MFNTYPKSISDLLLVLNDSSVHALIMAYGGTRIIIPKKASEQHELATVIGIDELNKLCSVYCRCTLDIPLCVALVIEARDKAMLQDRQSGMTFRQLARKYKITERSVYLRMRRLKQDKNRFSAERQSSLFELFNS